MTHSGGKAHRVGDLGQRYEAWCIDGNGNDLCIGYSDSATAFKNMVDLHPVWHSWRIVDRHPGAVGNAVGGGS